MIVEIKSIETNGMPLQLRTFLGLKDVSDYVRAHLEKTNRDILRYESIFITILSTLVLVSSFFPIVPWVDKSVMMLTAYRLTLLIIGVASVLCHFKCQSLAENFDSNQQQTRVVLITYTTLLLVVSSVLTVLDYAHTNSLFMYVVALVLIFGLLYIVPILTIFINLAFATAIAIACIAMGHGSGILCLTLGIYTLLVIVVSVSNFHTRKRAIAANEMVLKVSRHDSLTGAKNRRAVNEDAHLAVGHTVFLLLADIDDFKFYNDSFGHNTGDELLCAFSDSLSTAFGHKNVYRYGGDEFIAVALDIGEDEFHDKVALWRESFSNITVGNGQYSATTSAGYVYGVPQTEEELFDMLRVADIRLYDAKQTGRNKVLGVSYSRSQHTTEMFDAEHLRNRRSGEADALTGLPSMTYFLMHARVLLNSPTLEDTQLCFVYFDIENMKSYNERFGMAKGDELIVLVANTIQDAFPHALTARVGDDRFALVANEEDVLNGIDKIHETVRHHNESANTIIRAGIYYYERGTDVSMACDFAKLACDSMRGRLDAFYRIYNDNLHDTRARKQFILDRFEDALAKDHIQAYYQPIIRSISGRVSEFEALARWVDPDDGFISPGEFIPVLEEFRLIHLLDLHIIERACSDIRSLFDEGLSPLPVNVNLSRYDIELCDIAAEIESIMKRYDLPGYMLNIEETESAFSENTELLSKTIGRFHELGMQVWMDDFGSGYSSLNVLRDFDFDVVKFDMFFLRHHNDDSRIRSRMMVPHLINMAKELGIQTLVEGVETNEQHEFLREIGCEKMQGYAFSKPEPIESMRTLLKAGETRAEAFDERNYYDTIGQVDLSTPYAIDPEIAHSIEMSGGMPAAIVEFRDNQVGYLHWNSSYIDYLKDIRMDTIENSVAQMNDRSRVQSQGFFKAANHLKGKQEWLNLSFYEDEDLCTGMARCVAVDEQGDAAAFLYVAFNITHYLKRAGLSMPTKKD